MFLQDKIEAAAIAVISGSLATAGLNWAIHNGLSNDFISYPLVKVICKTFAPLYPYLQIGDGKAVLIVMTAGIKDQMSPEDFERGSDAVIEPFLADGIANTLMSNTTNLKIHGVYDLGLDVQTLNDGWTALQTLEVVCCRTS